MEKIISIKIPIYFRFFADLEKVYTKSFGIPNVNEFGDKTRIVFKQNHEFNSYHIVSDLDDFLTCEFYRSPFGENIIDWFPDEINKVQKFYF